VIVLDPAELIVESDSVDVVDVAAADAPGEPE
jgi:hypothetical protein